MPLGISWPQYLKFWFVGFSGVACGSQLVHTIYKPLEGFEDLIEEEYQKLKKEHPEMKISLEERVAEFDKLHKEWEEYEKSKPTLKLPDWLEKFV